MQACILDFLERPWARSAHDATSPQQGGARHTQESDFPLDRVLYEFWMQFWKKHNRMQSLEYQWQLWRRCALTVTEVTERMNTRPQRDCHNDDEWMMMMQWLGMMNTPAESEAEPRVSDTSGYDWWMSHTSTKVVCTRSKEGDIKEWKDKCNEWMDEREERWTNKGDEKKKMIPC